MSKKPGPAPGKNTKETSVAHSGGTGHPARTDPGLSSAEVGSLVDKKLSELFSKRQQELQSEIAKSTEQVSTDLNAKLAKIGDEYKDAGRGQLQRIETVEEGLRILQQQYATQERRLRDELNYVIDEKLRWVRQQAVYAEPGAAGAVSHEKCAEQLASRDAAHQQELMKLHAQHHQDMLSVISDCCRKLKTGFTRRSKPYDVDEVHAIIDDIEQKMVREIVSEIQKTNTHEDFSSFEEAFATSQRTGQLGTTSDNAGQGPRAMTTEDISAALETFESETFENWAEELQPSTGPAEPYEGPEVPEVPEVKEEMTRGVAYITGDRGNVYYSEELKKTVDDIISLDAKKKDKEEKTAAVEAELVLSPTTKSRLEDSLDDLIIPSDPKTDTKPKSSAPVPDSLRSFERSIEADQESPSDLFAKELQDLNAKLSVGGFGGFPSGLDDLRSLDSKLEDDIITPAQPAAPAKNLEDLRSLDSKIEADATAGAAAGSKPAASSKGFDEMKSLEAQIEADLAGAGSFSKDLEGMKSLEGLIEADIQPKEHKKEEHKKEEHKKEEPKKEEHKKEEHHPGEKKTSPPEPAKVTPSAPPATTTNVPSEKTPSAPADKKPSAPAEKTPAAPADKTASAPADKKPSAPADKTASAPADKTPSAPADKTPSAPADKKPSAPAATSAPAAKQETPEKQLKPEKQEPKSSEIKESPKTQKH